MLLDRCGNAVDKKTCCRRDIGFKNAEWTDAVDPHHRGCRIANDAASATSVRRCDDGGKIADMHFALEDMPSNRAADQGRCDVVQKGGQHEDNQEQWETAGPTVWQDPWHSIWNAAAFEVPRQDRKAHEQEEQVGKGHPLVLHLHHETAEPLALSESGENQLVEGDYCEPGQCNLQRLAMEDRDAEQRQAEQYEIDRDSEQVVEASQWAHAFCVAARPSLDPVTAARSEHPKVVLYSNGRKATLFDE